MVAVIAVCSNKKQDKKKDSNAFSSSPEQSVHRSDCTERIIGPTETDNRAEDPQMGLWEKAKLHVKAEKETGNQRSCDRSDQLQFLCISLYFRLVFIFMSEQVSVCLMSSRSCDHRWRLSHDGKPETRTDLIKLFCSKTGFFFCSYFENSQILVTLRLWEKYWDVFLLHFLNLEA